MPVLRLQNIFLWKLVWVTLVLTQVNLLNLKSLEPCTMKARCKYVFTRLISHSLYRGLENKSKVLVFNVLCVGTNFTFTRLSIIRESLFTQTRIGTVFDWTVSTKTTWDIRAQCIWNSKFTNVLENILCPLKRHLKPMKTILSKNWRFFTYCKDHINSQIDQK